MTKYSLYLTFLMVLVVFVLDAHEASEGVGRTVATIMNGFEAGYMEFRPDAGLCR